MRRPLFILVIASLILVGAGCFGGQPTLKDINLSYWRMEDDPSDLSEVIEAYRKNHPNVTIDVIRFPRDGYQKELLTAIAEGRGPDLFSIPQTRLKGWLNKIEPMPKEMTVIEQDTDQQGQLVTVQRKKPGISLIELNRDFVEVVPETVVHQVQKDKDSAQEQKIFGLPFSADTLVLYYNRDLLRNAGIISPPTNWNDMEAQSKKLRSIGEDKTLEQSGVAMGWTNIRHHTDILAVLMMQNRTVMNRDGRASFNAAPVGWDKDQLPAVEALAFFRSFAMKDSGNWSWERDFSGDMDFFVAGRTAFYFGFPGDAREITARAPRLDLGIAEIPQVDSANRINLAHFPVETVSKKSKYSEYGWDFLIFASRAAQVSGFLTKSGRPAALRSLLTEQRDNPTIGPFAKQVLTAKNWYLGYDYDKALDIFAGLVETDESYKEYDYARGLSDAVGAVQATYDPPKY